MTADIQVDIIMAALTVFVAAVSIWKLRTGAR